MKTWQYGSMGAALMAALLVGGGCDFGDPVDHSGGGTSIDGLTGTLVMGDGSPAGGAVVRIYPVASPAFLAAKTAVSSEALALDSVTTNASGFFQFKAIADGTYDLAASLRLGDNTTLSLYLPEVVVTGKTNLGTDTLHLSGSLVLQVRGANNQAIAGALCSVAGGAWQASSDSLGVCDITGVPPGIFQATITHPSHAPVLSANVVVVGGTAVSGGVVSLGGGIAAKRHTFPLLVPDSIFSLSLSAKWGLQIHRITLKVNGATITDSTRLPRFQPNQDHHVSHGAFSAAGGEVVELSAYGRTTGGPVDLMQGWDTTKPLFQGVRTLVAADSATDTLPVVLTWVGPQRPDTAGTPLPAAPTPTYPLGVSAEIPGTPTFTWTAVEGATAYHLEVIGNDFPTMPIVNDSNLTATSRAVGSLKVLVHYYWRVRARNAAGWGPWSATIDVFRDEMPSGQPGPTLLSPAAGATGVSLPPSLTWNPMTSTNGTGYHIQVSRSASFATLVLEDSLLAATSKTFVNADFSTTYYWRVRLRTLSGPSDWSEVRAFTTAPFVDAVVLTPPALTAPADLATGVATSPALTWNSSPGAMTYQVQVSTSVAFATLLVNDSTLTTTSRAVGPLAAGTTYYWRVRAVSPSGNSPYSTARSFTTAPAATSAWTARTSGTTNTLRSVTWTGSQYVAVGDGGVIRTSPDGVNWTARNSGTSADFYAVAWTGSLLVAGGDEYAGGENGVVFRTSPDGIVWTPRSTAAFGATGLVRSLLWTGNQLLGGGTSGSWWSSTDGINWASGEFIFTGAIWMSMATMGDQRVMVSGPSKSTATGDVAVSAVGDLSWESFSSGTKSDGTGLETGMTYGGLSSVASTGSLFVGVVGIAATPGSLDIPPPSISNLGTIMTSADGKTWTTRATGTAARYVIWTGNQLAAMGTDGSTMTSANGTTWTSILLATTGTYNALARGNQWVAVGNNGMILSAP